jgi:hypothetical protein
MNHHTGTPDAVEHLFRSVYETVRRATISQRGEKGTSPKPHIGCQPGGTRFEPCAVVDAGTCRVSSARDPGNKGAPTDICRSGPEQRRLSGKSSDLRNVCGL